MARGTRPFAKRDTVPLSTLFHLPAWSISARFEFDAGQFDEGAFRLSRFDDEAAIKIGNEVSLECEHEGHLLARFRYRLLRTRPAA
jgi:hypothetical protein